MKMDYQRAFKYDYLSDIGKSLLDEIYGNRNNFIKGTLIEFNKDKFSAKFEVHPLEDYIISYDQNLEDDSIVINIGERIGFNVVIDETEAYTPAEQFYDRCSYTIRKNSIERIKKIMDMNKDQFFEILRNLGIKPSDEMYYDRLNIDSHKYSKKTIQSYYNIIINEENEVPENNLTLYDEGIVSNVAHIKQSEGSRVFRDTTDDLEDEEDDFSIKTNIDKSIDYNEDLEDLEDEEDDTAY